MTYLYSDIHNEKPLYGKNYVMIQLEKINIDSAKIQRETTRWLILLALYNACAEGSFDSLLLAVVKTEYPDVAQCELRNELEFLAHCVAVKIDKSLGDAWFIEKTRYAVEMGEYKVDVVPGIARPEKLCFDLDE